MNESRSATILVVTPSLEPYNQLASPRCRVLWARDPKEGLKRAAETKPDLVIAAGWMALGETVQLVPEGAPVLLVCSRGRAEEQIRSFGVPVSDFIIDGFTSEDLRLRVAWLLSRTEPPGAPPASKPSEDLVPKADLTAVRDNFLDILVYDIRSPLSSVLVGLEFLMSEKELPPVHKKVLLRLYHSCTDLRTTLENFLDLERLEDKKTPPEKAPLDFKDLVKHAIDPIQEFLSVHGVNVQLELSPRLPTIRGEAKSLSRVVANLVMSAGKMSEGGSPVLVRSTPLNGGVQFQVQIQGQAIPNDVRDKIFDRYLHRGKGGWIFPRGFGTALAYSRRVVEDHGGRIWLEPVEPGGNQFNVFLPS